MLRAFRGTFQGPAVKNTTGVADLTFMEKMPAMILAAALLIVGLYPNSLLSLLEGCGYQVSSDATEQSDN